MSPQFAGGDKNREGACARHLHVLRDQQDAPPLHAIRYHSANQREQEDWDAAKKLIQGKIEGRVADAINEPALGHDLHPGADAGGASANPHKAKVAVAKRFEDPADQPFERLSRAGGPISCPRLSTLRDEWNSCWNQDAAEHSLLMAVFSNV